VAFPIPVVTQYRCITNPNYFAYSDPYSQDHDVHCFQGHLQYTEPAAVQTLGRVISDVELFQLKT
jgi:hypothetical protein